MDHAAHSTVETLQKSYTYVHQIALSQPCNGRMIIDVIQIFFASSQGGIDPPNQNPVDALEQPAKQNDYMCVSCAWFGRKYYKFCICTNKAVLVKQ